jgi:deaminated glutathione amidase
MATTARSAGQACFARSVVARRMGSWQLRVGAVQLRSTNDLAANLATCRALGGRAADLGAQLVVLPECFAFLGRGEGDKLPIAEDLATGGPILDCLREIATTRNVWVIGGGMPEVVPGDPKRTYNTAVVLDPNGTIVARYRKIHLFDVDIPGGATLRESDATCAGDAPVVVEIHGAKVGLSICYDVRFPELYRHLVKDRGAEILLVPAAFTAHTGAAHWHLLLRARAVEDQAYVVAAAQWGKHNEKRESFGHTLAVDPWGTILGEQSDGDGVVIAELDGAVVEKRRTQMPCLMHAVMWK